MPKQGLLSAFNVSVENFSKQREMISLFFYSVLAFFVPFFFKHPFELVFIITSIVFVLAAFNLRGVKIIPIVLLPWIGFFAGSYFFKDITYVVAVFIPVIWTADFIFVYLIKLFYVQKKVSFLMTLFMASALRYLILSVLAYLFIVYSLAPDLLLFPMGQIQLTTAFAGGVIAYLIFDMNKKRK